MPWHERLRCRRRHQGGTALHLTDPASRAYSVIRLFTCFFPTMSSTAAAPQAMGDPRAGAETPSLLSLSDDLLRRVVAACAAQERQTGERCVPRCRECTTALAGGVPLPVAADRCAPLSRARAGPT